MKILILSRGVPSKKHPQWGCFEKDQAEALSKIGHEVTVLSVDCRFKRHRGKMGLNILSRNGINYYNYISLPAIILKNILGSKKYDNYLYHLYDKVFKKIINKVGKPDIIYSHFFFNSIQGVKLKTKYKIPLITIEHLARFNEDKLDMYSFNGAKFSYENSDKVITVSSSLGKSLNKWFGIKYDVVHNVYGPEFGKKPIKKFNDTFTFITTGSLIYRKGFDVLIKAFAETKIPKDKWQLKIIGWGEEKNNLENLINKFNLRNNIFLMGKMDKNQISEQLSKSDAFILPSRNENFSVAIIEALSMGLPVIATDCGGIHECLNYKNGIIVPVDDINILAQTIDYIFYNYKLFDKNDIYLDAQSRFSPEAIGKQLTNFFEDTIMSNHLKN